MQHYLLFDSGCNTCSSVARMVASESKGWLEVRSLREPAMQELLHRARPTWKWEPTLLELEGEQVKVFTGLQLRLQMVRGLGLRQAIHIAQLIHQFPQTSVVGTPARRRFFKVGGAIIGGLALGLGFLPKSSSATMAPTSMPEAIPLASTHPVVTKLKKSRHMLLARKHFGTPDWTQVFKLADEPGKKSRYTVVLNVHPELARFEGQAVMLFNGEPLSRAEIKQQASGGKSRVQSTALITLVTTESTSEQTILEAYTPTATLVSTSTINPDGQMATTYQFQKAIAANASAFQCFVVCPTAAAACAGQCVTCYGARNFGNCSKCLSCAAAISDACYECVAYVIDHMPPLAGPYGTPPYYVPYSSPYPPGDFPPNVPSSPPYGIPSNTHDPTRVPSSMPS